MDNLHKQTLIKCSNLPVQGLAYLQDKKKQLILIAHSKGIKLYNCIKKQFEDASVEGPISSVTVSDDLVFYAQGTYIGAIGSNGKNIFQLNTFIAADRINRVHVSGYQLWVITGSMINQFLMAGSQLMNKASRRNPSSVKQTQDQHSHMFQAQINDSQLQEQQLQKPFLILLKNNNQIICFDNKQQASFKLESPPLCICKYNNGGTKNQYLVGCAGGQIHCFEISKKQIKERWKIIEGSSTKINRVVQAKNESFFVFRDDAIQIWGSDRTLLANQEIQQKNKIISSLYIPKNSTMFLGTASGNVIQMGDYTDMMKQYKEKNRQKTQEGLQKQIMALQKLLNQLKMKAEIQSKKNIGNNESKINVRDKVKIDYGNLCYLLELQSEEKIMKVILCGFVDVIKDNRVTFSGKQTNQKNVYAIQEQQVNSSVILFKSQQKFKEDSKLKVLVFVKVNGKMYGITKFIDIKPMVYHHKVPKLQLKSFNTLNIGGPFKYFEMNMWLNMIFNEFGSAGETSQEYYSEFYQSILTHQSIAIQYKNNECIIKSENPSPLVTIKKFLSAKAKQKHISFNISVQLEKQTVINMLKSLQQTIKQFQRLKEQYQLLPALMELKNDEHLSEDLRKILNRADKIKSSYQNIKNKHEILLEQLTESYSSYQQLRDVDIGEFQLDNFKRQLKKFDIKRIQAFILK